MLLRRAIPEGIRDGTVDLAFRRWRRPSVKQGKHLHTAVGIVEITAIAEIDPDEIRDRDARRAGHANAAEVLSELARAEEGKFYRIELRLAGDDPRIALRDRPPEGLDLDVVTRKLASMDRRKPWTRACLDLIAANPGVRAADLAGRLGREKLPFKADIRKLKGLGLTESLAVGYRLSPRGEAVLRWLRSGDSGSGR